jgi:uncharacterized protein GlcG (DUF336 family)
MCVLALTGAQAMAQETAPATLAKAAMSPENTKRAHMTEVSVETALALVQACIDWAKTKGPNGGASVLVLSPAGTIVAALRSDGQIPNNMDSAYQKAKTALYMRQTSRVIANRWGAPEPNLARAPLNMYMVPGGYPIMVEEIMLGAIGVGGATGGDEQCGHAALTKVLGPQPPMVPPNPPAGAAR